MIAILLLSILVLCFIDPIIQDPDYHKFIDSRSFFGVTNFWNVISNFPFLVVGLYGLFSLKFFNESKKKYRVFFIGVALVAFGSGFYHYIPINDSLVLDRLPMTIGFMALYSIVISEFIDRKLGQNLFGTLLVYGVLSIVFWVLTEDLRWYALVQFYPILTIPLILILSKESRPKKGFWLLILCYGLAKICEHFDAEIYDLIHVVSGHTLKHFVAAFGVYLFIQSYRKRQYL